MYNSVFTNISRWLFALAFLPIGAHCMAAEVKAETPIELPAVGTTVTGAVQNEEAGAAFQKFAEATHTALMTRPDGLFSNNRFNKVTADFKETPYWDALTQLCAQTGVFPAGTWDERLVLSGDPAAWAKQPYILSGPFRVSIVKTEHGKPPLNAPRGAAANLNYWNVRLTVEAEPTVHARSTLLSKIQVDINGRPVAVNLPAPDIYYGFGSGRATIALPIGVASSVTKLSSIKGKMAVLVATRLEPFVIEDIDQTPTLTKQVGNLKYEISIKPVDRGSDVQAKVSVATPMSVNEWKKLRAVSYENYRVFDASDNPFAAAGGGNSIVKGNATATVATVQYRNIPGALHAPKGPPKKFRWEVTTAYKEIEVPFEFKDVALEQKEDK